MPSSATVEEAMVDSITAKGAAKNHSACCAVHCMGKPWDGVEQSSWNNSFVGRAAALLRAILKRSQQAGHRQHHNQQPERSQGRGPVGLRKRLAEIGIAAHVEPGVELIGRKRQKSDQ